MANIAHQKEAIYRLFKHFKTFYKFTKYGYLVRILDSLDNPYIGSF